MTISYLVHQAGKVASQTLEATLRVASDGRFRVERHHFITDRQLDHLDRISRLPGAEMDMPSGVAEQVAVARAVRAEVIAQEPPGTLIVTGIREPLSMSVAAFFQNLPVYCPWVDYAPEAAERSGAQLVSFFNSQFDRVMLGRPPQTFGDALLDIKLRGIADWFDVEFKPCYGFDICDIRMPLEVPFVAFENNGRRFALYRSEQLDLALPKLLTFAGLPRVPAVNVNVAAEKDYADVYRCFKARFRPTQAMSAFYQGTTFFRTFYCQG